MLRITSERPSSIPDQKSGDKVHVYNHERGAGSFTRVISLPDDIDPGKVEASYRDGVLRVSVARQQAQTPKRIAVQ